MIRLWRDLSILQRNDGNESEKCKSLFRNTQEVQGILNRISAHSSIPPLKTFRRPGSMMYSIEWIRRHGLGGRSTKGGSGGLVTSNNVGGGGASWGDETRTNVEVR